MKNVVNITIEGKSLEIQFPDSLLRDWFAGQALNGLISHLVGVKKGTPQAYAERAYDYADAMIAAREKKP